MYLHSLKWILFTGLIADLIIDPALGAERVLRVCADPNNLPFSNEAGEGFENRIAEMLARDLGAKLEYTWWSERKSFVRDTLGERRCDVLLGVPASLSSVLATNPYYRSTYVFAWRKDRQLNVCSLSDPRFEKWRIGVHIVGDDYAPPAQALARRGLSANLAGFSLFGAAGEPNPAAKLMDAVARGDVDIAIVWGPFAGYFAKRQKHPLDMVAVSPPMSFGVPFTFEISAAVRQDDRALKAELDRALDSRQAEIRQLLSRYGVPLPEEGQQTCNASEQQASASSH